jgi:tetratricopeptide (TPR) repeat protein
MRREAFDALARIYRTADDLRHLLQVEKQLHESSPTEAGLTANYARLALLLEPNPEEAQRKAKEAYEAAPTDVNCAVTYAFALHKLGRTGEGLEILQKLPRERLLDSHSAVYASVLFLGANQSEAAQEFITVAGEGPLYPEEKNLLEEAMSKTATASATPAPAASPEAVTPP